MTRAEWLALLRAEGRPVNHRLFEAKLASEELLLGVLRHQASERKLRLCCCACARRDLNLPKDAVALEAIETAEEFADGQKTEVELAAIASTVPNAPRFEESTPLHVAALCVQPVISVLDLSRLFRFVEQRKEGDNVAQGEALAQCGLLMWEVFGEFLRPAVFNPNWRTTTATQLAQQMYDSRDFSATPILADALQDAGCEDAAILDHCRGPGPHVRGCWVVDLVLGKE